MALEILRWMVVLVLAYLVDAIKTKQDIDYINSRIDRIRNRER